MLNKEKKEELNDFCFDHNNQESFQISILMNQKMDGKEEVICQTNRVNLFLSVKIYLKKNNARNVLKIKQKR